MAVSDTRTGEVFDDETALLEQALSENDTGALAAMVAEYRGEAARWRAESMEKGNTNAVLRETIEQLRSLLNYWMTPKPLPAGDPDQ